jgi:hypothetical protein
MPTVLRLTPAACDTIADAGGHAIQTLDHWGLSVARAGSLSAAVTHLRGVARRGSYGQDLSEWEQTAAAVELVADWYTVASSLTLEPVTAIARELDAALCAGPASGVTSDTLSQFWFGTLLARAGLVPAVPDVPGRRPDFIIRVDDSRFGFEVKRPRTLKSAMPAVDAAAAQLRDYGSAGFIALDLSAALGARELITSRYSDATPPADQFRPKFIRNAVEFSDRVAGKRCNGRYRYVLGLFSYSRIFAWHQSDPESPTIDQFVQAALFPDCDPEAVQTVGTRVRDALREWMGSVSLTGLRTIYP